MSTLNHPDHNAQSTTSHHLCQAHIAAMPGKGPVYGHFVSKDFVRWAQLPIAIWNGLDKADGNRTRFDNGAGGIRGGRQRGAAL